MYNLFLDDIRVPYDSDKETQSAYNVTKNPIYYTQKWDIVRNYWQFVKMIQDKGLPKIISFDNDLGKTYPLSEIPEEFQNIKDVTVTEMSGYDALKWLCNFCLDNNFDLPEIWLHTANGPGFINMRDYIKSFNKSRTL